MYEKRVLIETYWNVNFCKSLYPLSIYIVLIETYWNVNVRDIIEYQSRTGGINRNILECKFKYCCGASKYTFVLIETYWNVNT